MHVCIAARFNGPPDSGNGGYSAGVIAGVIGEPVRVRLLRPVPMNHELSVSAADGGWKIHSGSVLIATAVAHAAQADVPHPPAWVEAFGASQHYAGFASHDFPSCFVCGPARAPGDGLRIFAGSVPGTNVLAAPWRPDASLDDGQGHVRPEFIWAALDCPGYFATCNPRIALLGEFAANVDRVPEIDEACVVIGWPIGVDGRKHHAGTALFDSSGARCAVAIATWIELKSVSG